MKKILITGSSGLLGANLAHMYKEKYSVYLLDRNPLKIKGCEIINLDLSYFEKTNNIISEIKPNLIIHCAALTNVDYCEEHQEEADLVNFKITKNLAKISNKINSKLIYISTDSIFDGKKGNYKEEDDPNPINFYAKTKLKGEEAVKSNCKNYIIARTNIYGWNAQEKFSLSEWILDKLQKNESFSGFIDIIFAPILVNNLGRVIIEMYEKNLIGIYNVNGSEKISKYDFAIKIAELFSLNKELIKMDTSDSISFKAKRPKITYLNTDKIQKLIQTKFLNVEQGLQEFKQLRENGFVKNLKDFSIQ